MNATVQPVPARTDSRLPTADRERVDAARAAARADNTRRTYGAQWQAFAAWCSARDIAPLPAAPGIVAAWLADRATTRRTATVRLGAAAVGAAHRAAGHPDPTAAPEVRDALRGIARQHAAHPDAAPRQARALSYDDALTLLAVADRPRPAGRGLETVQRAAERGRLDSCIVALLFCAGLRRSEAAAIRWADVDPAGQGRLRVRVRRSKTNQDGGRPDYRLLVNGFARALNAERAAADPDPADRIVPLTPGQIARRLAALGRAAGINGLSGHSGRVGLATELVRRGASTTAVQQAGGWRDPQMVSRYAAAVQPEDGAVARFFGGSA